MNRLDGLMTPNGAIIVNERYKYVVGAENALGKRLVEFKHHDDVFHTDRFDVRDRRQAEQAIKQYLKLANRDENEVNQLIVDLQELATTRDAPDYHRDFEAYTLAEMATMDFKLDYIVEGLFVEGQPMMIAGKDKTLKSTIAIDLAIGISTGGVVLNEFAVLKKQNVLFFSAESGMATLKDKARVNLESRRMTMEDDGHGLMFSPEVVKMTEAPDQERTRRLLEKHNAKVLIIDPTYLSLPSDAMSNVFAQGENLRDFSMFCQEMGVTLILVHHAKKTITHYDPLERGDIAGAGFGEFVRQWILINKRERVSMGTGIFKLWVTYGGSAGHSGGIGLDIDEGIYTPNFDWRQWEIATHKMSDCMKEAADVAKAKADQKKAKADQKKAERLAAQTEDAANRIIKTLAEQALTKTDMTSKFGKSVAVGAALDQLLDEGRIESKEIVKGNNRTYPGYQLA